MLQAGDVLGFGLEAGYEFRIVGVLRQNNLDRHFPADGPLGGAVDGAVGPSPDLLLQFIALDAPGRWGLQD